jgi:hypothetical protein
MTGADIISLMETFWPAEAEGGHLNTNPAEAVRVCREVASLFYEHMADAGLPIMQNGACVLVCAGKSDKVSTFPFLATETPDRADSEITNFIVRHELEPIGIAFMLGAEKFFAFGTSFDGSVRTNRLVEGVVENWRADYRKGKMSTAQQN